MDSASQVQTLAEAVCANALGKDINPSSASHG